MWTFVGYWLVGILVSAAVIGLVDHEEWMGWELPYLVEPTKTAETAAQVVPAVVVAIFVFAVGTQFVVAQVVPQTRGTRAVEVLRDRHLEHTLSPALALTPLSVLVLALPAKGWPLASALLIGSVIYLLMASKFLLDILREATDPAEFSRLLARLHTRAVDSLQDLPAATLESQALDRRVKDLYGVVRTLRGWVRSSATAGDSRELQIALEGTLNLVTYYVDSLPIPRRGIPDDYTISDVRTNPLREEGVIERAKDFSRMPWIAWVPPLYLAPETSQSRAVADREILAQVWVANEVGRSLVRAVEFATSAQSLLDRDRARLLLTLEKSARRFHERGDYLSAGVIVAYLVELGVGARRCRPEDIDWHFEPLARLIGLHRHFRSQAMSRFCIGLMSSPGPTAEGSAQVTYWGAESSVELVGAGADPMAVAAGASEELVIVRIVGPVAREEQIKEMADLITGTAAAIVKVTEAIAEARVGAYYDLTQDGAWNGDVDEGDPNVITIVERTVSDLRSIPEVGSEFTLYPAISQPYEKSGGRRSWLVKQVLSPQDVVLDIAGSTVLEPRGQAAIRTTDHELFKFIHVVLKVDKKNWEQAGRTQWMMRHPFPPQRSGRAAEALQMLLERAAYRRPR